MNIGDKVFWINGAVGLSGTIVDFQYGFVVVKTPNGTFYEYPTNLRLFS